MAEERRLFYVGMTRAKERLCLSWARWRWQWNFWCATPHSKAGFHGSAATMTDPWHLCIGLTSLRPI